jgi:glycosyltransferase involved in cell wall biosynthesis
MAGFDNVFIADPLSKWRIYKSSTSYSPRMARSRAIYAQLLINRFPDNPDGPNHYVRDVIAPRFLRQMVAEARIALRNGDQATIDVSLADIARLESCVSSTPKPYPLRDDLLITAVIPLFNGGPYIRDAIESILDQTLPPDELIVVDDGSTDDGPDIVREISQRHPIRLITKPNGGQSSARNLAVDHAHGDLIAFLDQDDIWYPSHLEVLLKPFIGERAIELGWSYSDLDRINESGEVVTRCFLQTFSQTAHPKRDLSACLRADMFVLPSASLISRKAFLSVGGFDERLSGYEDDDLFLRLFTAGFDNVFIADPLSKWRIYKSSTSYSPRMARSRAIYARMLIERFPDDCEDTDNRSCYIRDLVAPRFFRAMATEARKAILKGTSNQRQIALANLSFIVSHLRASERVPLQMLVLPVLHLQPLARFLMRYRVVFRSLIGRLV